VGGSICLLGQLISTFYMHFFDFTELTVGNPTIATLIIITMFLTGFGIYDHFGQFAGAGTAVPITGFANAVISSAIEHRTEGFVLGVCTYMLKLAGPVIVYGVFSSFLFALIKTIFTKLVGCRRFDYMLNGHSTWLFEHKPSIISTGTVGGPFEAEGKIPEAFDLCHEDLWLKQKSFEQAQQIMMEESCDIAIKKAQITKEQVNFLISGDLINQITPSTF